MCTFRLVEGKCLAALFGRQMECLLGWRCKVCSMCKLTAHAGHMVASVKTMHSFQFQAAL